MECRLRQITTESLGVCEKKRVDETEQLHGAFVLTQVLVTLQQELVLLAVTSCENTTTQNLKLFTSFNHFEDSKKAQTVDAELARFLLC